MKQKLVYGFFSFLLIATIVTACGKTDSSGSTTSNSSSGNNYSDSAVNPDAVDVTACSADTGISEVICLANTFMAQLSSSQLAAVQLSYSVSDAEKWSNLPQALSRNRVGLNFGSMTQTQIEYAKALLKAVAGSTENEGWDELQQLLNSDQYLNVNGGGSDYGAANYYIAFLGTPATTGTFEIQYGGHHTAFANTYENGVLAGATPSFRGVEPFSTF